MAKALTFALSVTAADLQLQLPALSCDVALWHLTARPRRFCILHMDGQAFSFAMSTDMTDMDNILAADGECAAGQAKL